MLPQPAACSSAIWPAKFWSRVDTRAYPKVATFTSTFKRDIRINKASENGQAKAKQWGAEMLAADLSVTSRTARQRARPTNRRSQRSNPTPCSARPPGGLDSFNLGFIVLGDV